MLKRTVLLFAVTLATVGMANAQKIAVSKGQKLETTSVTKMSVEVMGQNIDNETTSTTEVEVKDASDNGYVFANTLKHMVVKSNAMGQDIHFDSDNKDDMQGQMGEAMKNTIGNPSEVTVDKQGKIVEIKGAAADKKAPAGMNDMLNMSNSLAKGQAYPVLLPLPVGKQLKPGDSWVDSSGTPETFKSVMTYTLKQITGDDVLVSFTGIIAKNGTIEQQGMQIQMDITGNVKGDATYEAGSGFLKKNTTVSDIKGTFEVMGQSAPLAMNLTVNTVGKKL